MLKKFAADALVIIDIGKIISPSDYDKVMADDFIMDEDEEKIFFLIKSKTDGLMIFPISLIPKASAANFFNILTSPLFGDEKIITYLFL